MKITHRIRHGRLNFFYTLVITTITQKKTPAILLLLLFFWLGSILLLLIVVAARGFVNAPMLRLALGVAVTNFLARALFEAICRPTTPSTRFVEGDYYPVFADEIDASKTKLWPWDRQQHNPAQHRVEEGQHNRFPCVLWIRESGIHCVAYNFTANLVPVEAH
jgi:hypothetical protein